MNTTLRKLIHSFLKPVHVFFVCAALSGCGGGGGGANQAQNISAGLRLLTTPPNLNTLVQTVPPTGGASGNLQSPWNQYFVTSFNSSAVAAVDGLPQFTNSTFSYPISIAGTTTPVTTNALKTAHLDYALSTGLTGSGITVGLIDDLVNTNHNQFLGKSIYLDGYPLQFTPDFHGTAVASILVGNGDVANTGSMIGYAPGANLFAGYLNYNNNVDWTQLASYMSDANNHQVVAMNNSWGLQGATVANTNIAIAFGSGAPATYEKSLQNYVNNGNIVVFAAQNTYTDTSVSAMAGLPTAFPQLQPGWIAVINALPQYNNQGALVSVNRISAPCAEAASYCIAANGQAIVASQSGTTGYTAGYGASFAAPQVTGSIALLRQAFPTLTYQQIRNRIFATANNSFFAPTGYITFAPGVTHGYNSEFGMGLLDLAAALLPIGSTTVPTAYGEQIALGQAAIAGGFASGLAVNKALAKANVIALDEMGGSFKTPGSRLAANSTTVDMSGLRLSALATEVSTGHVQAYSSSVVSGNAAATLQYGDAFTNQDAATLLGVGSTTISMPNGLKISFLKNRTALAGASLEKTFSLGNGSAMKLGVTSFTNSGSILGVTVPGSTNTIEAHTTSVTLALATHVGSNTTLRAMGEFGVASGNGAGMVTGFTPVGYNRVGISLDRANAFRKGDVLTLFAREPIAITAGQAQMALPTAYSAGTPQFSSVGIGLAPEARQIDLGFEYDQPLNKAASLAYGFAYSTNAGNVSGQSDMNANLGIKFTF